MVQEMHSIQKLDVAKATVNLLLFQGLLDVSIGKVSAERARDSIVANPLANRLIAGFRDTRSTSFGRLSTCTDDGLA